MGHFSEGGELRGAEKKRLTISLGQVVFKGHRWAGNVSHISLAKGELVGKGGG